MNDMPLYIPNILFEDCWGSMGNISFYHRDGKCYWKTKPTTIFQGTSAQLTNAAIHKRAIQAWKSLEHDEQLEWSAIARQVPSKRLPYDTNTYISGYNLFVSAYHGFAQLGDEHTPQPKPYKPFPQFSITLHSAIQVEEDLLLSFNLVIPGLTGNLHPVLKLHLTHPSRGIRPGLMRSFLSMPTESPDRILVLIPDYKNTWNLDLSEYQAHIRYFLIDSETGYRSREQQISMRFEV